MNAAQLVLLIRDLITLLETDGILTPTGFDSTKLDTIAEDVAFAAQVEALLKKHGVLVPGQVDRIIQLLPLLAGFIQ